MSETALSTQPTAIPAKQGRHIKLDDATIAKACAHYPAAALDATYWLAKYTRERCGKNVGILETRARKVKHTMTSNTFYRILTGRYFMVETEGPRAGKIFGSVDNYLAVVDALRRNWRIEETSGAIGFIETGTFFRIRDYIDGRRMPDQVCRWGVIIGPTGAQKTASFREISERICSREGALPNECVHVESPDSPHVTKFRTKLALAYGHGRLGNQSSKDQAINGAVTRRHVVIIDNVQRLYNSKMGGTQPIFNYLQELQDDTGCVMILSFTPEFEKELMKGAAKGYFEQLVGRCGGEEEFLRLEPYAEADDILPIASGFGIETQVKSSDYRYLETLSRQNGRIRILFNGLQKGRRIAQFRNEPFTTDHIRIARGEKEAA